MQIVQFTCELIKMQCVEGLVLLTAFALQPNLENRLVQ